MCLIYASANDPLNDTDPAVKTLYEINIVHEKSQYFTVGELNSFFKNIILPS